MTATPRPLRTRPTRTAPRRRAAATIVGLALAGAALSACGGDSDSGGEKEYLIGFQGPLSGDSQQLGINAYNALVMKGERVRTTDLRGEPLPGLEEAEGEEGSGDV